TGVLLLVAYRAFLGLTSRVVARVSRAGAAAAAARSRTRGALLARLARWGLGFSLLVVVLREAGVDVQAIVASAGVVGLAVGFGAQALIEDVITGSFLLFEGLVAVGDSVQVGPHAGTVQTVGLRVTRLRLADGGLREAGEAWARATGGALEAPQAQGIMRFSGGDLVLRLLVTVEPGRRLDAELDLRREILETFTRERWRLSGAA
ncbi:MAG TPA: mechanosensitive ion channel domain-containing protein, partial [Methylomirabilota bacterium]|nr:mechanosensitive ion channel domain-containing protein [Methylomirabilota bacterium]